MVLMGTRVVVDEPDWSRIFEERFKMQISSSRREKTYTMYSNENEHVGEQLLEDQRKRTREDETITSDTKKAKTFNVSFDEYVDSYENDRIEIFDYPEILDVEQSERFELAKQSIWCIGDWTVLEPVAERCLQSLAKLNNEQIRMIGEMNDYLDKEVGYILELVRYTCEMLGKGILQRKNSENDIDMFIKRHIFACFYDILDTHFGEMVFRSSRDRRSEATDAPDKVEGFHPDLLFTRPDLGKDISYGRFSLCERAGSKRFFDRILDAIAGGTDTIANSISSSVHYPDVKQRLRKELDKFFWKIYKTIINKDLDRLQYCDAVVKKVYCHTPVDSTN
ncbi:unnamed protein product [Rhizophagus irregularis]|nr:unnamed protein product [Rhizophagus irregularis]